MGPMAAIAIAKELELTSNNKLTMNVNQLIIEQGKPL